MQPKSFSQYLTEAPLPDDWDDAIYNPRIPFAKRIRYAQERAQKAGAGSSRVAFIIPYEGRRTVLKVAKNKKGMVQNEVEAQKLEDWYLRNLGIIIPLIDYDEQNSQPTWIHTEFATKAKQSDFIKETGVPLETLIAYAEKTSGKKQSHIRSYDFSKVNEESELVQSIVDLVGNYDLPTGDFTRLANWRNL